MRIILIISFLLFAHQGISKKMSCEFNGAIKAYICYFKIHHHKSTDLKSSFDASSNRCLGDFLCKWVKKTQKDVLKISPEDILFSSCIYLTRLKEIKITARNIVNLSFVALVLACKFNLDHVFSNEHYARIGKIHPKKLIELERLFLKDVDYRLFIDDKHIAEIKSQLENNFHTYLLMQILID